LKALIISFYFLPSTCSNSKRPYYIAQGLLNSDWEVDVLTSNTLVGEDSFIGIVHQNYNLIRIDDPQEKLRQNKHKSYFNTCFSVVLRALLWPDPFSLWAYKALKAVDFQTYDKIIVFIMPISSMYIPYSKKVDTRWFFDFSESFLPESTNVRNSPIFRLMKPFLIPFQKQILSKAGGVIFNARSTMKAYEKRGVLKRNASMHIPNFYDPSEFKQGVKQKNKFIIEYTGQFGDSSGRDPLTFFQALNIFLTKQPEAKHSTLFSFHGTWDSNHTHLIRKYDLQDNVVIKPAVSHKKYITLLQEASVLLLITSESKKMYVPGKIYDYLGARRPILAFIPELSETNDILSEAKQERYVCTENDPEKGARYLRDLWEKWQNGNCYIASTNQKKWSTSMQLSRYVKYLLTNTLLFISI